MTWIIVSEISSTFYQILNLTYSVYRLLTLGGIILSMGMVLET